MASIASATVTLRGHVASRVVALTANGAAVTIAGDRTFAHSLAVAADGLVILTTIDDVGGSESRTVRIESESVPYIAPLPA